MVVPRAAARQSTWSVGAVSAVCGLLVPAGSALGQAVYPSTPDWISQNPHYSTGAALVDLDRDGWLDLVVSDGNDIQRGRLNVYYNDGEGNLPTTASWQSGDVAYNGHLDIADVNGDGWMDVAVAHLGEFNTVAPIARLYLNNAGTLSTTPDWQSGVLGNAFGLAFGDVDNDGRPDLAVGTGWAYSPQHFYANYVYRNVDGMLEAVASWESADLDLCQGVLWADGNHDGWLDLIAIGSGDQTKIYPNLGGALDPLVGWETVDSAAQDGIMLACGDVNGDGWRDLFATDNDQLGGSGRFKQYTGMENGFFEPAYAWSYLDGYGSAIALADVNADGLLDLATGAWWDRTRLFHNQGTGFDTSPSWNSGVTSVVEKIVFGDVDPACGRPLVRFERFVGDGVQRLFHLPRQPIQGIVLVRRDGVELTPSEYTFSRERGWISVGAAPTTKLEVSYTDSHALDMAISNWDGSIGNYLYYSLLFDDCNENGIADGCDIADGTLEDLNGNGVADACECISDLDTDGVVGFGDVLAILGVWGPCPGCPEDLDADGVVAFSDVLVVLAQWGGCS